MRLDGIIVGDDTANCDKSLRMKKTLLAVLTSCLPLAAACSSDTDAAAATESTAASDPQPMAADSRESAAADAPKTEEPFGADVDSVPFTTDDFTLDAGAEKYLCFAKTLDEDLVISGYSTQGQRKAYVHHLILARATAPEPEGFSECDIAFRRTWETLFISGAGASTLDFPEDAGHKLDKGTQVIVQMHLLNQSTEPVTGSVTIHMRRTDVENPRNVSSVAFGTAAVDLPAASRGQVVGTCAARQPVKLIAGFPHMHLLGKGLRFEVGSSADDMHEVFTRDPYDFDDQHIDKMETEISKGDITRVTCDYDNTLPEAVKYGESTHNEMCYFIGFAIDQVKGGGCLEVTPP
jgi:hypothetical protein